MPDSFGLVILAAGEGTRLKLDVPKPLAPISGRKLVDFSILAAQNFLSKNKRSGLVCVVLGHKKDLVEKHILSEFSNMSFALQPQPKGTADAVNAYFLSCEKAKKQKYTIVLCADTPAIDEETLECLFDAIKKEDVKGVAATFKTENPTGYGRIVRGEKGFKIVEHKDASEEELRINEVNSGLYIIETTYLLDHLKVLDNNNKSGEFYLTDVFKQNESVKAVLFEDALTFQGVNTLEQLEMAEKYLGKKKLGEMRDNGVKFIDSDNTYIEDQVTVGSSTTLYPNVFIHGKTKIGENCTIHPGVIIFDSEIEDGVTIKAYSHIEGSVIRASAVIGPFARLREGSVIGEKCKIGNFVETKKVNLDKEVSVSHLSYLGDAEVGENTNIGCGFITCNYDGESKHLTKIGRDNFIGSDSQMIAPVTVGDSCFIASGSTINSDVPSGAFAISRSKQVTKEGMAKKFLKGKWSKN